MLLCATVFATGIIVLPALVVGISCGPSGTITTAGSANGYNLVKALATNYRYGCSGTTIKVSSSNSSAGAQRVCRSGSAGTAVDIGILTRPFLESEATPIDDYRFQCATSSRKLIQVEVATDAAVLVVAPNGIANCYVDQEFDFGLTIEQLQTLFSSYSDVPPSSRRDDGISSPTTPTTDAPNPSKPSIPTPVTFPTLAPVAGRRLATHKPTLPKRTLFWCRFNTRSARANTCPCADVLVAGPPSKTEVYQNFARTILPNYGAGEDFTAYYYSGSTTAKIVNYVLTTTNTIGILPLSEYIKYQDQLVAVSFKHSAGDNCPPTEEAIRYGDYPFAFNIYTDVRSDSSTMLKRIRPFLNFTYSDEGDAVIYNAGLFPLSPDRKAVMLEQLGL